MATQLNLMYNEIPSDSYIYAYGGDCMEPGCRTRSNKPTLSLLLQGRVFRCCPASQGCP
jgi:hypothetical protein